MPADLKELRRQAGFVFVGTVEKLGAVATAGVAASPTTAVVRVDHVVSAPAELAGNLGRTVTLDLASKDLKEGDSATFFATSWVYGEGLALREIGHTAHTDVGEVTDLVASASGEVRDDKLAERVESAALIVLGRVAQIVEPEEAASRRLSSEHEAHWWIAWIEAEEMLKGRRPGAEIALGFPTSRDVAWYGAPRPQANQRAVWLLHKESHHELPPGAYVALDPRDVQPPATAPHIRELVKG
jgi:hypothetical protein